MKLRLLVLFICLFAHLHIGIFAQNVGIGTTTPQTKLDVNGNFKLRTGVGISGISADSLLMPGSDSLLPTQKAIKRYIQKGAWVSEGNGDPFLIFKDSSGVNATGVRRLMIQGNYAYVITEANRLCIYDITDPLNIVAKGFTTVNINNPYGLYVSGNYAYVTSLSASGPLAIFDISNPDLIVAKGTINTNADHPSGVFVLGNYAYVTSRANSRLCIYDIRNPDLPVAKDFTNANLSGPTHVYVQGIYAYVISPTGSNSSLSIYNISNPDDIVAKATIAVPTPTSIQVRGNYAYITCLFHGLKIFDISNPDNIVAKGSDVTNLLHPNVVCVQANYAYVSSPGNDRICVFDISDPDYIAPKGFTETNVSLPQGIAVKDKYVFVISPGIDRLCSYYQVQTGIISVNSSGNTMLLPQSWEAGANSIYRMAGNVGIGTTNPGQKLSIAGGIAVDATGTNDGTLSPGIRFGHDASGEGIASKKTTGGNLNGLDFYTGGVNRMVITQSGRVGIGVANPSVPLEVTSLNGDIGGYGYLAPTGGTGYYSPTVNIPLSIKASGRIVSSEFNAVSDQRIKKNISTSSSQNDLQTLLKIRVANYQLKDSILNGNTVVKGFIAQELETIMPQAVHTNADYVPDIYCLSTSTQYNEKDKTLKISLCKPHQLKAGDKVKVIAGDGMQEQYVTAINSENEFTLSNWEIKQAGMNPVEKVFVWGKWVTDFHSVDYNQVFSLGVSAMQQLAKENEQLKTESEEQKKINQSLQQQIDELKKCIFKK